MDKFKHFKNPYFLLFVILALYMLLNNAFFHCAFGKFDAWKSFNHIFVAQILKIYVVEVSKPLMPYIVDIIGM